MIILAGFAYLGRGRIISLWNDWMDEPAPEPVSFTDIVQQRVNANNNTNQPIHTNTVNTNTATQDITDIPEEFNLDVPFTTQAPHANWDYPYKELCEEASALTVHYFYQGKTFTKDIADQELLAIVDWENNYFGWYEDTTAEQTAELIREYWGYERVEVFENPDVQDIKIHVANGRPVIVPAAGRELGNPNFTDPGPLYHMFVIRGYTADTFVTNDVGTRRGENYIYDIEVVMDAMHDWNDGDVYSGEQEVVVVYPQ